MLKNKKVITVFVFFFSIFGIESSHADYYPSGPTRNVSEQTLIDNGWVKTYEQTYQTQILNDGIGLRPTGTHTILAGKAVGSSTISLLAAAPTADVFTQTSGRDNTRLVNGTYWYYVPTINPANAAQGGSIGFADTSTVFLATADGTNNTSPNRLSWHINLDNDPGSNGGYRLGADVNLNSSTAFLKQVWTWSPAPAAIQTPAPVYVRQTSNLTFAQSLYASDTLSDPDGELRRTVDQIMAKYGSLIK